MDIEKGTQMRISLTHVAEKLGVEKRRIYDIVNVVESLQMAVKVSFYICVVFISISQLC